jgi:hypothetical protein
MLSGFPHIKQFVQLFRALKNPIFFMSVHINGSRNKGQAV